MVFSYSPNATYINFFSVFLIWLFDFNIYTPCLFVFAIKFAIFDNVFVGPIPIDIGIPVHCKTFFLNFAYFSFSSIPFKFINVHLLNIFPFLEILSLILTLLYLTCLHIMKSLLKIYLFYFFL